MPKALTHEQCRSQTCATCGGKAGSCRVTDQLGSKIRKREHPEWNRNVVSHPNGICENCRQLLTFYEKEGCKELGERLGATQRWSNFHISNITVSRGVLETKCPCQIYEAQKSQGVGEKGFNDKVRK